MQLLAEDRLEDFGIADADNDDDPRPFGKSPPTGKNDDGDYLPELALKRIYRDGGFRLVAEQYLDAISDRSPIVDDEDSNWLDYGNVLGILVDAEKGLFEADDPSSKKERDAFDYGNEFEREE